MKSLFRITSIVGHVVKHNKNHLQFRGFVSAVQQTNGQNHKILSQTQIDFYHKNGYLELENIFTSEEKQDLQNWCQEIEEWPEIPGKYFKYHEIANGKRRLTRVEDYLPYHHDLRGLIDRKVTKAIEDLCGEPACTFKNKINFKFPGGIGYKPHQDEPSYDMFKQKWHIAALITADPMTIENGCLQVVPGKWEEEDGFLEMDANGDIHPDIVKTYEGKWVPIVQEAGGVVLFNSYIPHKSERNYTDKSRRAFYITWNGISRGDKAKEFYDLRRIMVPQDCERDPNKDYSAGVRLFSEHIIEMGSGKMK